MATLEGHRDSIVSLKSSEGIVRTVDDSFKELRWKRDSWELISEDIKDSEKIPAQFYRLNHSIIAIASNLEKRVVEPYALRILDGVDPLIVLGAIPEYLSIIEPGSGW